MTLVVGVVTEAGIVLGADSLVQSPQGAVQDEKLWCVGGRFGVVSFGSGPPGVPAAIRAFRVADAGDTEGLAYGLLGQFLPSRAPMSLFVAGHDHGEPQLFRVDVERGTVHRINRQGEDLIYDVWCGGVASHPMELLGGPEYWAAPVRQLSLDEAVRRTEGLIERTTREHPASVGVPVRSLALGAHS